MLPVLYPRSGRPILCGAVAPGSLPRAGSRWHRVAGLAVLVAVVTQSVIIGMLIVPMLGIVFLALAMVTGRYVLLFIPGSIMTSSGKR